MACPTAQRMGQVEQSSKPLTTAPASTLTADRVCHDLWHWGALTVLIIASDCAESGGSLL